MSTRRDLIYRMTADPEGFKKGMREAGKDSNQFWRELKKLEKQQAAVDDMMTGFGQGMVVTGAAIGVGLGLAAKAAVEWESAWTGVAKVVDGSPEQMAALEGELRDLATTLPQTHAEIAGVAAAAGQLGIARKDIAQFTETMVAMGVSTDLSSEQAAMSMARLMNIMQTAPDQVSNLGSAIVGLGNAGASTEAEIVEMALRIAGAGHTVGMTEAEVLGFASALASVGVEAESGGSSISTAMVKMAEAVNEGGATLAEFANVAGVSADEFAAKFRSDPAQAINMFVQGLGRIQASGGDTFGVLEGLGMSEIRLRDAMLRLAGAGDLLSESLAGGNEAWDENSALMEEAARRYGTTEAQMAIARNQLVDMGITLGEILLPAINKLLDIGDGLASFFQSMPVGLQQTIVWLGVAATAVTLIGGAALIAIPKLHALNVALGEMGGRKAGMAQKALGGVTSFLGGPWGIAIGAAVTVLGLFVGAQAETRAKTEELSSTLDAQSSAVTGNTRAWIANELEKSGALETAQRMGIGLETLVDAVAGERDAVEEVNAVLEEHKTRSEEDSTATSSLTADVEMLRGEEAELAGTISDLTGNLDAATESHERQAEATGASTDATSGASTETQVYAESLGIATEYVDEATSASRDFDAALRALRDTMFGSKDAQAALTLEAQRATEAFDENGDSLNVNTEAGALNHQAVMGLISANHELISAEAESGATAEELAATTDNLRGDFIQLMRQAGFSEDAIDDYADAFDDIPASKTTTLYQKLVTIGQWKQVSNIALPQQADGGYMGWSNGGLVGYPNGGYVRGPGGPRTDSILAMISNGEFVVNAESTRQNRDLLEMINSNRQSFASRPGVRAPRDPSGSGGTVRVRFDFTGVSDSMARAIRDTVKVDGNGDVQAAFGSR